VFEHFETPEEVFSAKLSAALTMEGDSLAMFTELEDRAQLWEFRELFRSHAEETRQEIERLERCFTLLQEKLKTAPSPASKGLAKEGRWMIAKTDEEIVDSVLLASALETALYEVGVYQALVAAADSFGVAEVVDLLSSNLDEEVAASEKFQAATERAAADAARSSDIRDAAQP
jgi:ferritin-like metal-binding protein YciE